MKSMQLASLLGTAALLLLPPAFAVTSVTSGWYVEGTLGTSKQQDNSNGNLSTSETGLAGSASIGYKFMPFVGTEIGYTQYSLQRLQNNGTTVVKDRLSNYFGAVKGIIPIANSGFEPFAKVGISRLRSKNQIIDNAAATAAGANPHNASSTGFYMAAGAQYYFLPELAIVAEWARANGNSSSTGSMDLYSVGLSYIF